MADGTSIEWTDATLNVVNGCSVLSPGCTNCYAMRSGGRNLPNHPATGLTKATKAGHVWTGEVRFNERALMLPLRWKRPRKIFWNAHGDLFHENVPDEWIDRCFAVMAMTPHHVHQVLTKRAERMRKYLCTFEERPEAFGEALAHVARAANLPKQAGLDAIDDLLWPIPNVWLGVSAETQYWADVRIPLLLDAPAAKRWISAEPLLGPLDLEPYILPPRQWSNGWANNYLLNYPKHQLDWVVAGGESGAGARPMHPDWARSLRDACAAAGVPFLFKQWGEFGPDLGPDEDFHREGFRRDRVMEGRGPCAAWLGDRWQFAADGYVMPLDLPGDDHEWVYRLGKKHTGRLLDGVQHDGYPA